LDGEVAADVIGEAVKAVCRWIGADAAAVVFGAAGDVAIAARRCVGWDGVAVMVADVTRGAAGDVAADGVGEVVLAARG
jgi:hypothetical protein